MGQDLRRIAFGSVATTPTAKAVRDFLVRRGTHVVDVPAPEGREITWPEIGRQVATLVAEGTVDSGVALCWTGNGVAISASDVVGVRAAYCASPDDAVGAREWHDANLLALRLDQDPEIAVGTVDGWLGAAGSADARHVAARRRLATNAA